MSGREFKLEYIVVAILIILVITEVPLLGYIDFNSVLQSLIVISFFVFSIIGIIGIFLQKQWGYFAIYFFILISSVLLGTAPIPLITKLFSIKAATFLVIFTSIILFLFTLFLQIRVLKNVTKQST
jgi:hypothetical protein